MVLMFLHWGSGHIMLGVDFHSKIIYNYRNQLGWYRPAKLSKVHFSRKFQGKMHLNFWLSGSPISPYFHPKNLPIPSKVYLLKVQGTKSKASIDFHCPLWQIPLSSRQLIRIQTLLSPLWSPSRFVLAMRHICSKNMFFGNACLCNLSLF